MVKDTSIEISREAPRNWVPTLFDQWIRLCPVVHCLSISVKLSFYYQGTNLLLFMALSQVNVALLYIHLAYMV